MEAAARAAREAFGAGGFDDDGPVAPLTAPAPARKTAAARRRRNSMQAAHLAHDQVAKAHAELQAMRMSSELASRDQEISMLHHEMDAMHAQDDAEEALIAAAADEFADAEDQIGELESELVAASRSLAKEAQKAADHALVVAQKDAALQAMRSEEEAQAEQIVALGVEVAAANASKRDRDARLRKAERDSADKYYDELREAKTAAAAAAEAKATRTAQGAAKLAADSAATVFDAQRKQLQAEIAKGSAELTNATSKLKAQLAARDAQVANLASQIAASKDAALKAELRASAEVASWSAEYGEMQGAARALQVHSNAVSQRLWDV